MLEKLKDGLQPQGISRMKGIFFSLEPCQWQNETIGKAPLYSFLFRIETPLIQYLFVHAVFLGELNHRLDILRLCLIEKGSIAHDETAAFAGSIDEFLAVSFHFIGCG